MDFDFQWLLLGLPIAFALGWLASRFDLKQWRNEQRDTPQAYFKGLNLLLNEQQDKAIDAFIEAVQHDPDTSDLHFALGNLFRRRGEYDRAVRVHRHLLSRADLPLADRERAQHELAQDFLKAGLFDRAEEAYRQLEGTVFDTEAQLALLTLYERSRDWRSAIDMAQKLERGDSGTGSFSSRVAHYWCELASDFHAAGKRADAEDALRRAREVAPHAARALVMEGQWRAAQNQPRAALDVWDRLLVSSPAAFNLVALDYAKAALACGGEAPAAALAQLIAVHFRSPTTDVLDALRTLDPDTAHQTQRLVEHLQRRASLSSAKALLEIQPVARPPDQTQLVPAIEAADSVGGNVSHLASAEPDSDTDTDNDRDRSATARAAITRALDVALIPLQRYRCAACGFEAGRYFWQCPGCQGWDTYPPRRLEDL
ncbi:lipopolysaccharide assembly protein LapB [soil metagenome]